MISKAMYSGAAQASLVKTQRDIALVEIEIQVYCLHGYTCKEHDRK